MLRREPKRTTTEFFDLDKIQAESVTFRLHGKLYEIAPLSAEQFFIWAAAYQDFLALKDKGEIKTEDLSEAYFRIFNAVCPTMTREDVLNCSQQQAAVLFGVIMDAVTGKEPPEAAQIKKKVLTRSYGTTPFRIA